MKGTHLVYVLASFDLGGAERQALIQARYLKDSTGAKVTICGIGKAGAVNEYCNRYGLDLGILPPPDFEAKPRAARSILQWAKVFRQLKADAILPVTAVPNVLCGLSWRLSGAALCVWGQHDEGLTIGNRKLHFWAAKMTPIHVAISPGAADFLVGHMGVPQDRVRMVMNAVELAPPRASANEWRARLQLPKECVVACMTANLTRNKDHATLIEAWAHVHQAMKARGKTAALVLAGRCEETAPAIRARIAELDLSGTVKIIGFESDIAGLLQASDVSVLSSRSEGAPVSVMEAMSNGLPVVGTDIPGIRYVLGPNSEGWVAPPGDAEGLANRILQFTLDGELRRKVGDANRMRAVAEFSVNQLGERMKDIITEGLSERALRKERIDGIGHKPTPLPHAG